MLYAILCYNSEEAVGAWSKDYHDQTMTRLYAVNDKLAREGRLGPVARLLPTILYLHGGGWVIGSLEGYDLACRYFCARSGCAVEST